MFISLVVHVFIVVGLFFIVLPTRREPPRMVVALPEREQTDPEETRKKREESLSSAPKPKASLSLPSLVADILASQPVACSVCDLC